MSSEYSMLKRKTHIAFFLCLIRCNNTFFWHSADIYYNFSDNFVVYRGTIEVPRQENTYFTLLLGVLGQRIFSCELFKDHLSCRELPHHKSPPPISVMSHIQLMFHAGYECLAILVKLGTAPKGCSSPGDWS